MNFFSEKGFSVIPAVVLIVLIFVSAGLGFYFLAPKEKLTPLTNNPSSTPVSSIIPLSVEINNKLPATPSPDPTSSPDNAVVYPHGYSMMPLYKEGQSYELLKDAYNSSDPKLGDVIAFKNPRDNSQIFIKRIIGLPGEAIAVKEGRVFINEQPLNENYVQGETLPDAFLMEGVTVNIPENKYVVMGDTRKNSSDSREWGFIDRTDISGKLGNCLNCEENQ